MQGRRIKISPVWPDQRVDLRINPNLAEQGYVTKRTEYLALQDALEINDLFRLIVETHAKRVGRLDFKKDHAIDGMTHVVPALFRLSSLHEYRRGETLKRSDKTSRTFHSIRSGLADNKDASANLLNAH